jgi:hypothetical protein
MPRNVRNFWLEADIDGRKETLTGGPKNRDGGISITLKVREKGEVSFDKLKITGVVEDDKYLLVTVSGFGYSFYKRFRKDRV